VGKILSWCQGRDSVEGKGVGYILLGVRDGIGNGSSSLPGCQGQVRKRGGEGLIFPRMG
jgi:hypothetical protein